MRALKTALIFIAAFFLLFSCDSSGSDYFFENPVAVSVLKNVKCVNGSVSYIGFVVDNTEKYGARIMKISGCGQKIDKDFKDNADDKTGIYVGGAGVGIAQIVKNNEVIIGTISSGKVNYDHYKNDEKELEEHNGRLVLRTLKGNFVHDKALDKSVLLDFHPALVESDGNGFFIYGTYFGKNYLAYVRTDGSVNKTEIDFQITDMIFSNGKILLFDGSDFLLTTDTELTLKGVWEGTFENSTGRSGISALSKGRTAVFHNTGILIFDHNFNLIDEIILPEEYDVTSVSSTSYTEEFLFRSFPRKKMNEKVIIYEAEDTETVTDSDIEEDVADSDEETPDIDVAVIFDPVNDIDSETQDNDSDQETDSDVETDDQDAEDEVKVLNAEEGDIIWIATSTGSVLAYDIKSSSWMVTYYTEEDEEDTSEYYLEMRPYLDSSFTSYPEYGATGYDNAPFIKKISVARGLSQSYTYNFTYEGIIEGSRGTTGVFDNGSMIFSDENVDFQGINYDIGYDRVVLLDRKSGSDCMIPLNTNITMDIITIDSPTEMTVNVEEYAGSISSCYGNYLSYGIYPEEKYSVAREDVNGKYFTGRADELSSDTSDDTVSYSDEFIDISIQRKTDEVVTSKETNYYIKISPGVPFIGLSSNDLIVEMEQTVPGKILMFSPLTRRFVEYDVEDRDVVEVYK